MIYPVIASFRSPRSGRSYLTWRLRAMNSFSRIGRAVRVDAGATMVEFAMASIILFTLIFGVMAICLALYSYNVVAESAREATRYAIVRGSKCSSSTFSDCNVTGPQLQTYVQGLGFPGINPSSLTLAAAWPSTTNCSPSASPCNNPGNLVQVTVNYSFPLVIPFVPSRTLTMSSTSAMTISQ